MENENKLTPELIEKVKKAVSIDELLQIAKDNDIELSKEDAEKYMSIFHKNGELADDELDNVAGGGCYDKEGYLLTTIGYCCEYYSSLTPYGGKGLENTCFNCTHWDSSSHTPALIIGYPLRCRNKNNRKYG